MPAYDSLLTLKTPGLQSASTNGTSINLGKANPNQGQLMQFDLYYSALGGATSTIDVIVEESPDQSAWRQVTQFRQLLTADAVFTGANQNGKKIPRFGLVTQQYMRYRTVMGGAGATLNFSLYARGMDAVAREVPVMSF